MMGRLRVVAVGLGPLIVGACGNPGSAPLIPDIIVSRLDTLIPAGSPELGFPAGLDVDRHGTIYLADAAASQIVVIGGEGGVRRRIGGPGAGPGEFQYPRQLSVTGDTLLVLDANNLRLQRMDSAGRLLRIQTVAGHLTTSEVSFGASGQMLASPMNGSDAHLAVLHDPAGAEVLRFGAPVVAAPPSWNYTAIKATIRAGRVPAELRNLTLPVLGPEGDFFLVLAAEGEVRRYDQQGTLLWTVSLPGDYVDVAREEFFHRNAQEDRPHTYVPLRVVMGARLVAGELWLLMQRPGHRPGMILCLDREKVFRRRMVLPAARGLTSFAVDTVRGRGYLVAGEDTALLSFRLPAGLGQ